MVASRAKALRFTRLRLKNWRNFRSVDIALEARAFIVGPNASGKSNLLDAFRFLAEIARPGSGGLQAAIEARGGFSLLRCLHARNPPELELEAQIGTVESPNTWRYLLRVNRVRPEKIPTVVHEEIARNGKVLRRRTRDNGDARLFSQTMLEQVEMSLRFTDLTDFLGSCRYLHVVPQIVRDRSRARVEGDDPYGGDLLRRIKETPRKSRLPRLNRISEALRLAVPQFQGIDLEDDTDGVPHLVAKFEHWRGKTARQNETSFSDGTLRLIGLLWSITEKGGPLLLEEPELSLNDAVIQELPRQFQRMQKLSGRQVITTTHSGTMLDQFGIGLREVHRIQVDADGSRVITASSEEKIAKQVEGGLTISQAVLPLLAPQNIEKLGILDIAG